MCTSETSIGIQRTTCCYILELKTLPKCKFSYVFGQDTCSAAVLDFVLERVYLYVCRTAWKETGR
jgi:hypothetical protein